MLLLFYFFCHFRKPRHWGHHTVVTLLLSLTLSRSSWFSCHLGPPLNLRECGHNQWSCWLTSRRPTSNALLRLIVSHSLSHKLAPNKVYLWEICCGIMNSTKVCNTLIYLLKQYSTVQFKGFLLNTN